MARGKTLGSLLDGYRAEARLSLNPANNNQVRDTQVKLLQRVQEWLWEDFDWPHLRVERQYAVQAGQRIYDFGADFDLERIEYIEFKSDGIWRGLSAGIENEHYAVFDSDLDQRGYPVCRYKIAEDDQIEVWPISDKDADATTLEGYFKVKGVKRLSTFVADSDQADLDDRLIILFAAAETLGADGAKDASIKLNLANKHYAKLRGKLIKRRKFQMFGIGRQQSHRRSVISNYRPPGT
jgi:hypothetical protein